MSTTFSVVDGPEVDVQDMDWDGNLLFNEDGSPKITYSELQYSLNVSGINAAHILSVLGYRYGDDGCGEFPVDQLPAVRQRLLVALNRDQDLSREDLSTDMHSQLRRTGTDGNVVSIGRGCQIVDCSHQDESIRRRLEAFMELVVAAQKYNSPIVYC